MSFFPTILSAPKLNQSDIKNNSLFLVPVRTDTKNHSKIEKHAPSDADVKIFVGSGCLSFSVLPLVLIHSHSHEISQPSHSLVLSCSLVRTPILSL
jgi:hypothetical protein